MSDCGRTWVRRTAPGSCSPSSAGRPGAVHRGTTSFRQCGVGGSEGDVPTEVDRQGKLPARLVPHYVLAMTPISSGSPASRKCRAEPDRGSGVVLRRCRRPRTPFEVAISKARIRLRSQHIVRPRTQTARQSPGRRSRPCPSGAPGSTDRSCRHSPGVVPLTGWCPARGQPLVSEFNRQSCPSAVSAG